MHKHETPPRWERLNEAEMRPMQKTIALAREAANQWWYCAACRYMENYGGRMTTRRVLAHLNERYVEQLPTVWLQA